MKNRSRSKDARREICQKFKLQRAQLCQKFKLQLVLITVGQTDGIPRDVLGVSDSKRRILGGPHINISELLRQNVPSDISAQLLTVSPRN